VYTVHALLIVVLVYGLAPSVALFFSWRLSATEGYTVLNRAVAAGLLAAGLHFLVCNLMRGICAPRGLAEAHFRIPKIRTELYRWHITWYMAFGLPMVFLAATFYLAKDDWQNSIGRFSSMMVWLCQGLLFLMVFRPNGPIMSSLAKAGRKSWIHSLRYVLASLVVLLTVTVIVRAANGYYYGARYTAWCLELTAVLLLGTWLLWHMVNRWLVVLWARWQASERAAARDAKPVAQEPPGSRTEIFNVPRETEEESLRAPREQTDRFIRFAMVVLLFAGLWLIWSDVLPAVNSLKRIELWSFVAETTSGKEAVSITLGGVTLAAFILVFSFLAAMNLPGFLEIAVLQHLPIDQGVRFAICALSRYAIGTIGIIVACGQLGVGWSNVQLPVAAMTIGLAFGLQEIVGNFVAGIIVLLEQPIRVGDTVTLGDTTGVVTKVRIRATTLQQWDRKELLVPNKEFITGRLINWTLTDDTLRLEFPVGIAYGSDTRKAERVLYQVARANEDVLLTPTPFVAFLGFGDSALEFELRVFISKSKPDIFILTRHRINRAIDDAFREAGIEIAFPQRDLHLRSAREPLRVQTGSKQGQDGGHEDAEPTPPTAGG
jgi:potassium efflux system protein